MDVKRVKTLPKNSRKYILGTKMIFVGIKKKEEMTGLIAYPKKELILTTVHFLIC